jgi:hypothetical protein
MSKPIIIIIYIGKLYYNNNKKEYLKVKTSFLINLDLKLDKNNKKKIRNIPIIKEKLVFLKSKYYDIIYQKASKKV